MNRYIALGVSIGVLAGIFTWVAGSITAIGGLATPLIVWVGFAAWACFYAVGGTLVGLGKTVAATVSGLLWGWLIAWAAGELGSGSALVLGVCVAVGAFGMCAQALWAPLAFIPGAFIGAASYFGTEGLFWSTLISLVVGALLAYASEVLGDAMVRRPTSRHASEVS